MTEPASHLPRWVGAGVILALLWLAFLPTILKHLEDPAGKAIYGGLILAALIIALRIRAHSRV